MADGTYKIYKNIRHLIINRGNVHGAGSWMADGTYKTYKTTRHCVLLTWYVALTYGPKVGKLFNCIENKFSEVLQFREVALSLNIEL